MRGRGRSEKQNQQQAEAAGIDYLWPTLDMVIVLSAVAAADLLPLLLLEVNRLNFFGLGELVTSLLLKIMFLLTKQKEQIPSCMMSLSSLLV